MVCIPITTNPITHTYDINKVDLALANALGTIASSMILFGNTTGSQYLIRVANSYPTNNVFTIESVQRIKDESDIVMNILTSQTTPTDAAIIATVGIVSATSGIALQELQRVVLI